MFRYRKNADNIGQGVMSCALTDMPLPATGNFYGPRYDVRRSMNLRQAGYGSYNPQVPFVDLRGNGVYLSGTFALTGLAKNG